MIGKTNALAKSGATTLNTVIFMADGEEYYSSGCVSGSSIAQPPYIPSQVGKAFAGWYDESDNKITFPYTPQSTTTTLHAVFETYAAVPYVQSNGTQLQYVDTGIVPTPDSKYVVEYEIVGWVNQGNYSQATVFGTRGANTDNVGIVVQDYNNRFYIMWGTTYDDSDHAWWSVCSTGIKYQATLYSGHIIVNRADTQAEVLNKTWTVGAVSTTKTIHLWEGNGSSSRNISYLKIYSFKAYENDVLVQDLTPVRTPNNTIAFLDLVSGQVFENAGQGSFTTSE